MEKNEEKKDSSTHWSQQKEKVAGYWHIKLMLIFFRLFPTIILRFLAFPVGFFYFVFSKKARAESKRFLTKAAAHVENQKTAKKCRSPLGPLRHIVSFALALVEKLESWGGKFDFGNVHFHNDDIGELKRDMENERGVFLLTSHLGNIELLRGLVSFSRTGVSRTVSVTAVIDMKVSENFNRMIKELNPQSDFDIITPGEIGPHTAVLLEEKLAAGGIVTIAGDRTSAGGGERNFLIEFLGEKAPFSPGAFYLASLLKAPVYLVFGLRRKAISLKPQYDMYVHKSTLSLDCSRKERLHQAFCLAESFAALLENYCKEEPFQWYNFYDFWSNEV